MQRHFHKKIGKVEYHQGASLGAVIKEFLEAYGLNKSFAEAQVATCWEKLMGTSVARNTRKISLNEGLLQISVDSAALRYELKLAESQLCDKLNEALGGDYIKQIKVY